MLNYIGARFPVNIFYKSITGRYRSVRVADGPITARYRFIKNASWVICFYGCYRRAEKMKMENKDVTRNLQKADYRLTEICVVKE